jgi:glutamate-1-semialdehyde 2,1-aminomutase
MMCDKHCSLLVLDEVITGFRFAYGDCGGMLGAQSDIVCLGKVIGGGFPIGAYGGRKEIMELVAPLGGVYQAGTFSGNLASVTAGLRTLSLREEERPYPYLERLGASLEEGLMERAGKAGVEAEVTRFGSMLSLSFRAVEGKEDGRAGDASPYSIFFHKMLDMGFYLPPSPSESWFLSSAHSEDDVAHLLEGSEKAFREVRRRS